MTFSVVSHEFPEDGVLLFPDNRRMAILYNYEICKAKFIAGAADVESKNCMLQDVHYEKLTHAVY